MSFSENPMKHDDILQKAIIYNSFPIKNSLAKHRDVK